MNIGYTESLWDIVAKMCVCNKDKENSKKVTYSFADNYHYFCIDKRDVISAELEACERLLKYTVDEIYSILAYLLALMALYHQENIIILLQR